MKYKKIIWLAIAAVIFFSLLFGSFYLKDGSGDDVFVDYKKTEVKIGDNTFFTYISDTELLRARGLSVTNSIKEDEAMLFVFDSENFHSFWMKDMKFSIDIAWIDKNFRIISVKENISPETFPKAFSPDDKALYVMEFSAGVLNTNKISVGEMIEIVSKE